MNAKLCALVPALAGLLLTALPAWAQNDQTLVVGGGFGLHSFSQSDTARQAGPGLDEMDTAGAAQLYVEWYALGPIGFGMRYLLLGGFQGSGAGASEVTRDLEVRNLLLTAQWVPLGAQGYARLGVLAGVGSSNYDVRVEVADVPVIDDSTSGTASLLGVFFDWGGEGFGARLGLHSLWTDLDNFDSAEADASGTTLYLDLRWAFP